MKRLLSGLQPSGELTIGNYCGGIRQFLQYQKEYDSFLFVPDMHTPSLYVNAYAVSPTSIWLAASTRRTAHSISRAKSQPSTSSPGYWNAIPIWAS